MRIVGQLFLGKKMRNLKFSLLSNALDSLVQGIEFALNHEGESSKLKLSILLLAQSVELVLKERLRREHWSLIFSKVDQAGVENAHTVTIKDAQKRLAAIASVNLTQDDGQIIKDLADVRNQIQHYKIEISYETSLSYIHSAIGFLIRFLKSELDKDINELLSEQQYQKLLELEEIYSDLEKVAEQRIVDLQNELQPVRASDLASWHFEVILCSSCLLEYYVFSQSERISQCQFCNFEGGFVECSRCGMEFPIGIEYQGEFFLCDNCEIFLAEQ
jgi:hypothetical protein